MKGVVWTVKQIPKIKLDTSIPSTTHLLPPILSTPITPEGYIDEALTPNETNFKPFVTVEEFNGNFLYVYNESNWKSFTNKGIQDRISFIETVINNGNINDLDPENIEKLQTKAIEISLAYNQ